MESSITERVKQVMDYTKQSPTAFADSIGVNRPSMSHILSGRNKPSLDIIQKIITNYPHINPLWLINAQGEMLQLNIFESEDQTRKKDADKTLTDKKEKKAKPTKSTNFVQAALMSNALDEDIDVPSPVSTRVKQENVEILVQEAAIQETISEKIAKESEILVSKTIQNQAPTENIIMIENSIDTKLEPKPIVNEEPQATYYNKAQNNVDNAMIQAFTSGKQIEKIVIFYSDKTFSVYNPE